MRISARMLACIVAGLVAAVHAPAATGQTVAATVEQWGLLGTWAFNCTRPPAMVNGYISYVRSSDGKILHVQGLDHHSSREIIAASITPDGLIEVVADFGKAVGVWRWRLVKGADGRVRTMASSKIDGTVVTVRDGRLVHSGQESRWVSRCVGGRTLEEIHAMRPRAARDDRNTCPEPPA